MTPAPTPLDRLIAAEEALIEALDRDEVAGIEAALTGFRASLEAVRAAGGWRETPELVASLRHALRLAEASRSRILFLADRTRRQLDRLSTLGAGVRAQAYGRDGKVRAA